jgi:glucose/arabinose dehydrogenase
LSEDFEILEFRLCLVGSIAVFTASIAKAATVPAGFTDSVVAGGPDGFAPDGTLFVAVGDNANGANAQTLTTRLGKLLRITTTGGIPTDNQAGNSGTSTVQVTAR